MTHATHEPARRPSRHRLPTVLAVALAAVFSGCGGFVAWEVWRAEPAPVVVRPHAATPSDAPNVALAVDDAWLARSDVPHVSVFYDALAPYGVWTEDAALGWIWAPSDETYVPYGDGRWVETEVGPTFLCDAPHGWATAHYGRWFYRGRWYWAPDTQWGPAWVSWRGGAGVIGWAPLTPEAVTWPLPDTAWRFVPVAELWHPQAATRAYAATDVPWLLASSRPLGRQAQVAGRDAAMVIGPSAAEARFAGWRSGRVALARLPQERLRWVPRYERSAGRLALESRGVSVRAGPVSGQRYGRKSPSEGPDLRELRLAPKKDPRRDRLERAKTPKVLRPR